MRNVFKTAIIGTLALAGVGVGGLMAANAAGGSSDYKMKHMHWHFDGWRGTYDRAAMQRGYQVYREVCASCHQLKYVAFRHLGDKGGPYYDDHYPNPNDNPYVKAFAADWTVEEVDLDTGDIIERPAIPADMFPPIYPNAAAAAASNGGAVPPDLSVMVKARTGGADYVYNVLTSYDKDDNYMNKAMGIKIAMANPLSDGLVEYADTEYTDKDGKVHIIKAPEATVDQMAKDVTEFLAWAADPKMEQRKSLGLATMLYLLILTILLWFSYKAVWRNVEH